MGFPRVVALLRRRPRFALFLVVAIGLIFVGWTVFTLLKPKPLVTDGMGARITHEEALRMARQDSPLVEETAATTYTAPPTVHVITGRDKDGRELKAFVYTTVITYAYTDELMPDTRAREIARQSGFPADAIWKAELRAMDGIGKTVFWRLDTHAGFIWIDARTGEVLRRLDHE